MSKTVKNAKRKRRAFPEAGLQIAAVQWFKKAYPEFENLIIYINNNSPSIAKAVFNKKMGVLSGFPDVFLFMANNDWHGMAIEFKAKGRKPRPEQLAIHSKLISEGYAVEVITSLPDFKRLITNYVKKA